MANKAGKGARCPHCGEQTFRDTGSYRECSRCGYLGWARHDSVKRLKKRGKGNKCPNCGNQTLHRICDLPGGERVRRCAVCDFSAIEPARREEEQEDEPAEPA